MTGADPRQQTVVGLRQREKTLGVEIAKVRTCAMCPRSSEPTPKPTLVLLDAKRAEFEDMMRMFERLTGRPPTEEERAEALRE
jgi:hypothetical protein